MNIRAIAENPSLIESLKSREEINLECNQCNKEFGVQKKKIQVVLKHRGLEARVYCSKSCQNASQTTAIEIECAECHSKFMRSPGDLKKSKDGKQYCSHKCRAIHMNWIVLAKERTCKGCGDSYKQPRLSGRTSKYCLKCTENKNYPVIGGHGNKQDGLTVAEYLQKRGYTSSKSREYHAAVRKLCREWNDHLIGKPCQLCNPRYDRIIEFCHIKPVREFQDTDTLGSINDESNILLLCPTHHAEFDRGWHKLEDIPKRE